MVCEKLWFVTGSPFSPTLKVYLTRTFASWKSWHPDSWDLAGFIARRKLGFVLTDIWMDEDPSIEISWNFHLMFEQQRSWCLELLLVDPFPTNSYYVVPIIPIAMILVPDSLDTGAQEVAEMFIELHNASYHVSWILQLTKVLREDRWRVLVARDPGEHQNNSNMDVRPPQT